MSIYRFRCLIFACITALLMPSFARAEDTASDQARRIAELERRILELSEEIQVLKEQRAGSQSDLEQDRETIKKLASEVEKIGNSRLLDEDSWVNRFTLGGYGELHANFGEGDSADQFDIHRLVLYLGYDFNEWIKLHSETEIEHAFVSDGSGGELVIEQLYADFLLSDALNVRLGRVLTPLGITNQKHEPTAFNGVERPSFDRYIIPTTWSSDGVGIFGTLIPSLTYEAYVVGGLDGSQFNALDGIREGRIAERPSLHEPAFTGRLDYRPFMDRLASSGQMLRLGVSTYAGGLDNGNKGDNPDITGDIRIYSGDFEYTLSRFDFKGAVAIEEIDEAKQIGNGTASEILGWYLEAACHVWPDRWRTGKFEKSDAVVFVRYDDFDTQYKMPSGVARDPAGDRTEWTIGANFYLLPNFVLKADYQIRDDASGEDIDHLFNLGAGWQF